LPVSAASTSRCSRTPGKVRPPWLPRRWGHARCT
jgi:hypothetical protein